MGKGVELALESIAGWDVWGSATADDDGLGVSATESCPSCGYTGQMNPPAMAAKNKKKPKKLDPKYMAAEHYESYQDLRDALCQAVGDSTKYGYVLDFGSDWVVYSDDSEEYWKATYSVGDSGQITLQTKVEVHRVFVPVA